MTQEQVPVLIVGAGGAGLSLSLLLRPDGFVAWRSKTLSVAPQPKQVLEQVVAPILGRSSAAST